MDLLELVVWSARNPLPNARLVSDHCAKVTEQRVVSLDCLAHLLSGDVIEQLLAADCVEAVEHCDVAPGELKNTQSVQGPQFSSCRCH